MSALSRAVWGISGRQGRTRAIAGAALSTRILRGIQAGN